MSWQINSNLNPNYRFLLKISWRLKILKNWIKSKSNTKLIQIKLQELALKMKKRKTKNLSYIPLSIKSVHFKKLEGQKETLIEESDFLYKN